MDSSPQLDRSEAISIGGDPGSFGGKLTLESDCPRVRCSSGAQRSKHALGIFASFERRHPAARREIRFERSDRNGSRTVEGKKLAVDNLPPAPSYYFTDHDLIDTPVLEIRQPLWGILGFHTARLAVSGTGTLAKGTVPVVSRR